MDKSARRTPKRPLLDRAYWLSRPIEERLAAAQAHPGGLRGSDRFAHAGLIGVAELLNASGIEYLVVGAYALAAHGLPRPTGDLDIWLEPARGNIYFLLQALANYGFGNLDLSETHLSAPETVARLGQLGHPPARIDLITAIDGVRFAECYPRRVMMPLGRLALPVIELEDLRANKRASARAQDLADLDSLGEAAIA